MGIQRSRSTISGAALLLFAAGCGGSDPAPREATRVLRPDEVKITIGGEAPASPAPAATETAPAS